MSEAHLAMTLTVGATQERWEQAQSSELSYWKGMTLGELTTICAAMCGFVERLDHARLSQLFDGKEVLEVGCGPLGLSLGCFYAKKERIRRLVKIEPLPQLKLKETPAQDAVWARPFVAWVAGLASEGDYVRQPGELLDFHGEFDTVISYNVIDHVKNPRGILENAFMALRSGGTVLIAVDCMSLLGRLKFEHYTRRVARGSILVDAHPHSFRTHRVTQLLSDVGFRDVECLNPQRWLRNLAGHTDRIAFIARRP
jgi:SAM-dependent methyltransferase